MIVTLQGFTQQLVPVNGIKINAVTGGSGPPILLLHGWPETWWEWHHVMPLLAEQFSVVAIDLRGAGFSECPLDGYDKATMARDAHEVMVALGHERYAVCGHDIGGMVALPQAGSPVPTALARPTHRLRSERRSAHPRRSPRRFPRA